MYQEALLSCVPARTFAPFANIYLAYIVSAMTSLDRAVRRDSLALLALLLDRYPTAVADRADRLAPNYAALLALDPASKKQTGRTEALKSLVTLFGAVSLRYGREGSVADEGDNGDSMMGISGVNDNRSASAARFRWNRRSHRNSVLVVCPCSSGVTLTIGGDGGERGVDLEMDAAAKALAGILPQVLERLREVWLEALVAVPPDIGLLQNVTDVLLGAIASPAWTADGWGGGSSNNEKHDIIAKTPSSGGEKRGNRNRECGRGESSSNGGIICSSSSSSRSNHIRRGNAASVWFARFVPLVLEAFPVRALEGEILGDMKAARLDAIEALNMRLCELVVAASPGRAAPGANGTGAAEESCDATADWLQPVLAHVHEMLRDGLGKGRTAAQVPSMLRVVSAAMHSPTGGEGESESWRAQR